MERNATVLYVTSNLNLTFKHSFEIIHLNLPTSTLFLTKDIIAYITDYEFAGKSSRDGILSGFQC